MCTQAASMEERRLVEVAALQASLQEALLQLQQQRKHKARGDENAAKGIQV
jgi:hypothetical protein